MLVGVVGKPNCGKSTLFKAFTLADVLIADYPFATIKPNHGIGYVRVECADKFFGTQCNPREGFCIEHNRFVPIELLDVAGLVPGAYEGKGMGNQFLDDLRQADALIHVIDISGGTNEMGEPVKPGSYEPENDIRFLEREIDMWYLGILNKGWDRFCKLIKMENKDSVKEIAKQFSGLKVTEDIVKESMRKLNLEPDLTRWSERNLFDFAVELRLRTKPMIIAANKIDVPGADENLRRVKELFPNYLIIPCSAESEVALKEASKHELIKYIPGNRDFEIIKKEKLSQSQINALEFIRKEVMQKHSGTGVQNAINEAVFGLLKCIAIFPGGINKLTDQYGRVLPDCFLMPPKTTALGFAYKIHTDFGENFIRAIDVKKRLTVGKDYPLHHGDVVEIVSGK
ncbi:MAG: redox-regulated ATPase YchF [Candidatus Woesearchaeota archaeon]|nr:redox-regulated ATPase YchF [Candidatus Woesearchaeota archaeon]